MVASIVLSRIDCGVEIVVIYQKGRLCEEMVTRTTPMQHDVDALFTYYDSD